MSAKIPFLLGGAVIVEQVFNWPAWAHGVAGRAGPRLPGDHGHRARRRRVRAYGNLCSAWSLPWSTRARPRSNREQRVRRYVQTAGPIGEFSALPLLPAAPRPGTWCTAGYGLLIVALVFRFLPARGVRLAARRSAANERRADQRRPSRRGIRWEPTSSGAICKRA